MLWKRPCSPKINVENKNVLEDLSYVLFFFSDWKALRRDLEVSKFSSYTLLETGSLGARLSCADASFLLPHLWRHERGAGAGVAYMWDSLNSHRIL